MTPSRPPSAGASTGAVPTAGPGEPASSRRAALGWPAAGLIAGAGLGLLDGAWAIAHGVEGLGERKAAWLVALAGASLALAGVAVGAGIALASALLARRARGASKRVTAAVVAALAAPVLAVDALAMFRGRKAAEVPGHQLISVGLAVLGTVLVYALARRDWGSGASSARRAGEGRRLRALGVALFWLVVAGVAERLNHDLLRRLYPWFHATLALVTGMAALLAVHSAAGERRPVTPTLASTSGGRSRLASVAFGLAVLGAAVVTALGGMRARTSQTLRFALSEKTVATAELVRMVPNAVWRRAGVPFAGQPGRAGLEAAGAGDAEEGGPRLPPLPEGPRRPEADVLIITVDALRADHVGAYGYARHPTTPHIDKLASQGVRFAHAYRLHIDSDRCGRLGRSVVAQRHPEVVLVP